MRLCSSREAATWGGKKGFGERGGSPGQRKGVDLQNSRKKKKAGICGRTGAEQDRRNRSTRKTMVEKGGGPAGSEECDVL